LFLAQQFRQTEDQMKRGFVLDLEVCQSLHMQGQLSQPLAEGTPLASVSARQGQTPAHKADGATGVISSGDVEQRRYFAHAVSIPTYQPSRSALERQFCGGQGPRAQFVLEPVYADFLETAGRVTQLDVEQTQSPAALRRV